MSTQPWIDPNTGRPAKRPASIYTVMLFVTVLALIISCVLLYMELSRYDMKVRAELTWNRLAHQAERFLA